MDEIRLTRYINPERDDLMYPVDKVKVGYDFWFWKILNILIDIFEYDNLPSCTDRRYHCPRRHAPNHGKDKYTTYPQIHERKGLLCKYVLLKVRFVLP